MFQILRTKECEKHLHSLLEEAIRQATHSMTPKIHLVDDHELEQLFNSPSSLFSCTEECVEQNHQSHKYKEQVKLIKNKDTGTVEGETDDVQKCVSRVHKYSRRCECKNKPKPNDKHITPPQICKRPSCMETPPVQGTKLVSPFLSLSDAVHQK